jgi:hypothetical protein
VGTCNLDQAHEQDERQDNCMHGGWAASDSRQAGHQHQKGTEYEAKLGRGRIRSKQDPDTEPEESALGQELAGAIRQT